MVDDGDVGYEAVRSDPKKFHIVFLDNQMVRMNGVEAARLMRKVPYEGLIIGLTANAIEEDKTDFVSCGADIVMTKPLKVSKLYDILNCYPQ